MAQRSPVVLTAAGLAELPAADTVPVPAFGVAGPIAGCKLWVGEAVTTSGGAWSVDLTSAGFSAAPKVFATALSTSTSAAASAAAVLTARSAAASSGFVNLPATVVVGGLGAQRAGAGITVMVLAIGA